MNTDEKKKNITAIILCGGEGQRLRPITNDIPKPLIKIKNKLNMPNTIPLNVKAMASN